MISGVGLLFIFKNRRKMDMKEYIHKGIQAHGKSI
jgi:hypothetical protein